MQQNASDKNSAGNQVQINGPSSTDSVSDNGRNFKQELRRNKKIRFRKSDKRRRAEIIAPSCPL
jgi:hypothetical protein